MDFGLNDKFCDANDLKSSYEINKIPDAILIFFPSVFEIKKSQLNYHSNVEDLNFNEEESILADPNRLKIIKIQSLVQIMHYIIKNGRVHHYML